MPVNGDSPIPSLNEPPGLPQGMDVTGLCTGRIRRREEAAASGVVLAADDGPGGGAYADRVRSVYGWLRGHPLVVDSLLALVVLVLGMSAVGHRHAHVPVAAALVFVFAMAIPVALRRRYPVGAFVAVLMIGGLEVFALPKPSGSDLAVIILLYTVAAYRPRRVSVAALAVCLVGSVVAILVWAPLITRSLYTFTGVAAVFAGPSLLAWLLGDSMQWRRGYYRGLEERAVRAERERDAQAQIAVAAERARIARELHDVVAHNVSVMVVQADGAAFALESSPARAREALTAISRTGRQALAEMRSLLGVLRSADEPGAELAPQPGVEQLAGLLEQTRAAGLPVSFAIEGVPRPLPPGSALAAYRIVQESLTNARKHGGPAVTAAVTLRFCEDQLVIKVTDDGRARAVPADADGLGHGLIGMRERVEVHRGTVTAGPRHDGGWQVTATLPLSAAAAPVGSAAPLGSAVPPPSAESGAA
jgi:signal transduction histidine kinase